MQEQIVAKPLLLNSQTDTLHIADGGDERMLLAFVVSGLDLARALIDPRRIDAEQALAGTCRCNTTLFPYYADKLSSSLYTEVEPKQIDPLIEMVVIDLEQVSRGAEVWRTMAEGVAAVGGEGATAGAAAGVGGETPASSAAVTSAPVGGGLQVAAASEGSRREGLRSSLALSVGLLMNGLVGVSSVLLMRLLYFGYGYETGLFGESWAVFVEAVRDCLSSCQGPCISLSLTTSFAVTVFLCSCSARGRRIMSWFRTTL